MLGTTARLLWLPLVLALTGCELLGPCEDSANPGISLTIVDAATMGRVTAASMIVVAREGSYADSVRFVDEMPDLGTSVGLAWERPGLYDLEVTATGYERWAWENIPVGDGRCHVDTVEGTVRLTRTSSGA